MARDFFELAPSFPRVFPRHFRSRQRENAAPFAGKGNPPPAVQGEDGDLEDCCVLAGRDTRERNSGPRSFFGVRPSPGPDQPRVAPSLDPTSEGMPIYNLVQISATSKSSVLSRLGFETSAASFLQPPSPGQPGPLFRPSSLFRPTTKFLIRHRRNVDTFLEGTAIFSSWRNSGFSPPINGSDDTPAS